MKSGNIIYSEFQNRIFLVKEIFTCDGEKYVELIEDQIDDMEYDFIMGYDEALEFKIIGKL